MSLNRENLLELVSFRYLGVDMAMDGTMGAVCM